MNWWISPTFKNSLPTLSRSLSPSGRRSPTRAPRGAAAYVIPALVLALGCQTPPIAFPLRTPSGALPNVVLITEGFAGGTGLDVHIASRFHEDGAFEQGVEGRFEGAQFGPAEGEIDVDRVLNADRAHAMFQQLREG